MLREEVWKERKKERKTSHGLSQVNIPGCVHTVTHTNISYCVNVVEQNTGLHQLLLHYGYYVYDAWFLKGIIHPSINTLLLTASHPSVTAARRRSRGLF